MAILDELAGNVHGQDSTGLDETGVAIYLHHGALPKLAAQGSVEFDSRGHTVRRRVEQGSNDPAAAE